MWGRGIIKNNNKKALTRSGVGGLETHVKKESFYYPVGGSHGSGPKEHVVYPPLYEALVVDDKVGIAPIVNVGCTGDDATTITVGRIAGGVSRITRERWAARKMIKIAAQGRAINFVALGAIPCPVG